MAGNENDSLTPKQIKFVDAMLTEPTIEKACKKAGVSRATGYKYLKKTIVKRTIQTKQNEIMDRTTQTLYTASTNAVNVLNTIMTDEEVNPLYVYKREKLYWNKPIRLMNLLESLNKLKK